MKRRLTPKQRDLIGLTREVDQAFAEIRRDLNAETGKEMHLFHWAQGGKVKLNDDDKATIRQIINAGLMAVSAMNLRQEVMQENMEEHP